MPKVKVQKINGSSLEGQQLKVGKDCERITGERGRGRETPHGKHKELMKSKEEKDQKCCTYSVHMYLDM